MVISFEVPDQIIDFLYKHSRVLSEAWSLKAMNIHKNQFVFFLESAKYARQCCRYVHGYIITPLRHRPNSK